jgi:DNA-directed RNA polymerase specialized sigma24 family protein
VTFSVIKLTNQEGLFDISASEQLLKQWWLPLVVYCERRVPGEGEDLAANVLLKILQIHAKFDRLEKQAAWVWCVACNECVTYLRKPCIKRRQRNVHGFDVADHRLDLAEETWRSVEQKIVEMLTLKEVAVMELLKSGCGIQAVARELDMSIRTASRIKNRIKIKLIATFV